LRSYVKNILAKLGAHSRLEAAAVASRQPGLLTVPTGSRPLTEPTGFLSVAGSMGTVPAHSVLGPQR
jgi:hypothetical protein